MKKALPLVITALAMMAATVSLSVSVQSQDAFSMLEETSISLPKPVLDGPVSVEKAICSTRPATSFTGEALDLQQLSQILWAAREVIAPADGAETASPIHIYIVADSIKTLLSRIYRYEPNGHKLVMEMKDYSMDRFYDSVREKAASDAPACLVIAADKGGKLTYLDAGQVAQNISLQAVAVELSTAAIGDFRGSGVAKALKLPGGTQPLYIMPLGKQKG